jgi:hypothetical protein
MEANKMGSGRWSSSDWTSYTLNSSYSTKSTKEIYSSRSIDSELNPKGVKIRESRDSDDNPQSNAIIIGLDVTGSMSSVLDAMARQGLNGLVTNIYDRKPVSDPHILCMGIGDVEYDSSPLQITQFEADIRIAKQLEKLWLEEGGGGNSYESYALAWYFAAMHTSIDCFEKRNKRGYLFTAGDEEPTPSLTAKAIRDVMGEGPQTDMTGADLFAMASRQYDIFHLMVEEGSHFRRHGDRVVKKWTGLLGQRAIRLADHTKFAETVVSLIQVNEGASKEDVIKSWDGTTSVVVGRALEDLDVTNITPTRGVVTF